MSDLVKRILIGSLIGLVVGLLISSLTYLIPSFHNLLDKYEFTLYDSRMKAKANLPEASIDDVVIIDIDAMSTSPKESGGLGRFYNWPQAYHGKLIDVVTNTIEISWSPYEPIPAYYQFFRKSLIDFDSEFEFLGEAYDNMYTISGKNNWENYEFAVVPIYEDGSSEQGFLVDNINLIKPKGLLFDIIFDPENTSTYDLVDSISKNNGENKSLAKKYLEENNPRQIYNSTFNSDKVYHAMYLEDEDSLNFLYKMDKEPEGYSRNDHLLNIPIEDAIHLPSGKRFGNKNIELLSLSQAIGSIEFPQDLDGLTRRAPTAVYFEGPKHVYPSLVMANIMDIFGISSNGFDYDFENNILTLSDTTGKVVRKIPIDNQGRIFVNFYGANKTFNYLPYMYCVDPNLLPPDYWKDKVAFVGTSLPGLYDLRNTPVQETFPGVEIHANVMYSILQNEFVSILSTENKIMIIILLSIIIGAIVSVPSNPFWSLPISIFTVMIWIIFSYYQFLNELIMIDMVRPIIAIISTYIGFFLYNFLIAEKDKRFLKNTFGTYISPELIDQMYENKEEPQLGGNEGYHTAFFTDIQSFSGFSEKLSAPDLVELLNDYLTEMTDILLANKGTLDKYIGDAIVAFYGAPAPVQDHEYWGCLTAIKMQERLAELRTKWQSEGDRWPEIVHNMQNRIGINSGPMVTGNMGSSMRMNYTMMGDTVNLAARLEASAKQYGIYIQVAEETYEKCKDKFIWRDLDYVVVMGKTEPAKVYELISEVDSIPNGYNKLLKVYNEALNLYRSQNWKKAIDAFKESNECEIMFPGRKTNPSQIYIPRCEYYLKNSPGDNWDGSWSLTKK